MQKAFIELLLHIHLPNTIKISKERNSIQHFISEFKKFSIWLDQRKGTAWTKLIMPYNETIHELTLCEELLNKLYLQMYPQFFETNWDYEKDLTRIGKVLEESKDIEDNFFEIIKIEESTVLLANIFTNKQFQISDIPVDDRFLGIILHGSICRLEGHTTWSLLLVAGLYPKGSKRYLTFMEK